MNGLYTDQMVYFGNLNPGNVYIDAKPVPGTSKVVLSLSPGHCRSDHSGSIAEVSVLNGPDDKIALNVIKKGSFRDPFPLSSDTYMVAKGGSAIIIKSVFAKKELV